uniref:Uncharacterized protein n=1 Tax=Rhizophora mucronata TaxID=61149 RepID=A0A2P2M4N4_RHIMU
MKSTCNPPPWGPLSRSELIIPMQILTKQIKLYDFNFKMVFSMHKAPVHPGIWRKVSLIFFVFFHYFCNSNREPPC